MMSLVSGECIFTVMAFPEGRNQTGHQGSQHPAHPFAVFDDQNARHSPAALTLVVMRGSVRFVALDCNRGVHVFFYMVLRRAEQEVKMRGEVELVHMIGGDEGGDSVPLGGWDGLYGPAPAPQALHNSDWWVSANFISPWLP